ncbi:ATP-binding protein [Winogradskya consettensis]|uniref:ATP-binding protein n=1 Tax=Winogradskya consettensis TaxID=113560 RepID=UPI001BB33CD2|nr:tetratricopeptide repeat protein [Actinoplanes consettensis]
MQIEADRKFPVPYEPSGVAEFVRALRDAKVWGGNPSLEELRRRTGIASSTLSDALNTQRRRLPPLDIVRSLVQACGADSTETARWEQAWRTLFEHLRTAEPTTPTDAAGELDAWIPRQLPSDVAGFTGRQTALTEVLTAIEDASATVITGTAGVGKTTLAVHAAHHIADRFPDGQLYLDLRGYSSDPTISPEEALPLLLQSLGVPVDRVPPQFALQIGLYRSLLATRRVLVVLDNVIDTIDVRPLLPGGRGCHALITSRHALTGLVVREGAARITLDLFDPAESRDLLTVHLGATRVRAEPDAAAQLAHLCAHLPLALRIVAANVSARCGHTLDATVRELRNADPLDRLRVVGDPESAVAAAFDVSYHALPDSAQRLFRLLGLVPGPEIGQEAAAVLLGRPPIDPVPEIEELLAAHLLFEVMPGRYRTHDLLARYARHRAGDEPEAMLRLFSWYLLSADAATEVLFPGRSVRDRTALALTGEPHRCADAPAAAAWLTLEMTNMTAVVSRAAENNLAPFAWHLVHSLSWFLYSRAGAGLSTMMDMAKAGIRTAEAADDPLGRANCHLSLALASTRLRNSDAPIADFTAAREQYLRAGDVRSAMIASNNLGDICIRTGDITKATRVFEDIVADETTSAERDGSEHGNLATVRRIRGEYADAQQQAATYHAIAVHGGDPLLVANAEVTMAMTHVVLGEPELAEPLLRSALAAAEETGSDIDRYDVLAGLVLVCARTGRHDEAATWSALLSDLLDRGMCSYIGDDWAHAAMVEAHLAAARPRAALTTGLAALAEHHRSGSRLPAMRLRILLGQALTTLGDLPAAQAMWQAALSYASTQNLPDRVVIENLLSTRGAPPAACQDIRTL